MTSRRYESKAKALEYAEMSWDHIGRPSSATPFYDYMADLCAKESSNLPNSYPLIIEVGFGAGRLLHALRRSRADATVLGVEQSSEMIDIGRHITDRYDSKPDTHLIRGDAASLPLEVQADLVVTVNVLDRVSSPFACCQQLAAISAPSAVLVVATAFDYDPSITPKNEQLSPSGIISVLLEAGCILSSRRTLQLVKHTDETLQIFDVEIFRLEKRAI
jgi:SAM-dependent methyltransferase